MLNGSALVVVPRINHLINCQWHSTINSSIISPWDSIINTQKEERTEEYVLQHWITIHLQRRINTSNDEMISFRSRRQRIVIWIVIIGLTLRKNYWRSCAQSHIALAAHTKKFTCSLRWSVLSPVVLLFGAVEYAPPPSSSLDLKV